MGNLENLESAVQKMLEGERKRRSTALEFVKQVENIMLEVAPDMWGNGPDITVENTIFIPRRDRETGKLSNTAVYFRYKGHEGKDCYEGEGFFYADNGYGMPVWGTPVDDLRGSDFWYCIQVIFEWLPILLDQMGKRTAGREELLSLMNTEPTVNP